MAIKFETLEVTEKVRAKRGRKPNVDQELVDAIASIPEGKMLMFTHFGHVNDPEKRTTIGQQLRSAAAVALGKGNASVEWTPVDAKRNGKDISGYPQVSHRRVKASASA